METSILDTSFINGVMAGVIRPSLEAAWPDDACPRSTTVLHNLKSAKAYCYVGLFVMSGFLYRIARSFFGSLGLDTYLQVFRYCKDALISSCLVSQFHRLNCQFRDTVEFAAVNEHFRSDPASTAG